jgi:hypothetical protein
VADSCRSRVGSAVRHLAENALEKCFVWTQVATAGRDRVELLDAYRALRVDRIQALIREASESDDALESFAADARSAGGFAGGVL